MVAPRTFLKSAALVASTMIVLLVLVVSALVPRSSRSPLPLAPNQAATLTPPPEVVPRQTLPMPAAAPISSAAPLSAVPVTLPPVEIVVLSSPPSATVSRDGQVLGLAPGPFALPSGTARAKLDVSAVGYEPGTVEVVPSGGKTVSIRLQRARVRQPRAPVAP